jgi:hypothetical protein
MKLAEQFEQQTKELLGPENDYYIPVEQCSALAKKLDPSVISYTITRYEFADGSVSDAINGE